MKRIYSIASLMAAGIYILSACTLGSAPTVVPTTEPVATQVQNALPSPSEVPTTLVEVPIDLAGPIMEVGSKYLYVDGSILVAVPGGPFLMGNNNFAQTPEREVTVGDFWIYSAEVTNSQFALCVNAGKCSAPDMKKNPEYVNYRSVNLPVVGVNYQQSADYCSFVNGRLPTEAEWEKSARGPEGNLFPWGDQAPSCDLLNYDFCKGKTLDIQSFPSGVSYYGLFDMSGNVREWVADWFDLNYYSSGPTQDPLGPELGDKRSVRSSSFGDSGDAVFPSNRFSLKPNESLPDLGFRCVVESPAEFAPMCTQLSFYGQDVNGQIEDCTPNVKCNDVNIGQGQSCIKIGEPYTIVTFSMSNTPPNGWDYEATGCDPLGGDKFDCRPGDGPLKVKGSCDVTDSGSCTPVCAPHYNMVGDQCVWDGSGTEGTKCITGTTYDAVNKCCTATPGSGVDYNQCPGKYVVNGVCVDEPPQIKELITEDVKFKTCDQPGDTPCDPLTDSSCTPTCDPLKDPNCQPPCNPQTDPSCRPPTGCTNGPPTNGCPISTQTGKPETWNPNTCRCE